MKIFQQTSENDMEMKHYKESWVLHDNELDDAGILKKI